MLMTYYPLPDEFYADPQFVGMSADAVALWTRAASWSAHHLTDGVIPSGILPILKDAEQVAAEELVDTGIWRQTRGGAFRFADWPRLASRAYVESKRDSQRARQQRLRSSQGELSRRDNHVTAAVTNANSHDPIHPVTNASGNARGHAPSHAVTDAVTTPVSHTPQSSPFQSNPGGTRADAHAGAHTRGEPPPPRCPRHLRREADGPCGPCGDARRARQHWDDEQELNKIMTIRRCRLCDADGWRYEPGRRIPITPYVRCDHTPLDTHKESHHG